MENTDRLFERIIRETNKRPEEIREMVERRKAATHGLLSDYGALYAVAKELGLDINSGTDRITLTEISLLKPKNAYNIAGRVKHITPVKEFQKKDGSSGKMSSMVIADSSGEVRVVLWDNNAEIVGRIRRGDVVLVRNGYSRNGLSEGSIEVHAGSMSNLLINPKMNLNLPEIEDRYVSISELNKDMNSVNLVCRVLSYNPPAEFRRQDGSEGLRASFIGEDSTGRVRVVLWGEAAKTSLQRGQYVKIENGYVREGLNQGIELQVGGRSSITVTDETLNLPPLPEDKDLKVVDVRPDMSGFSVIARVLQVYNPKTYAKGSMASMIVADFSGTVRVVLWNEKSDIAKELRRGDAVHIKNAYSRLGQAGDVEIHVGRYGEVTVNPELPVDSLKEIEASLIKDKKIIDLATNDRYVRITGKIADIDEDRRVIYMTCSACGRRVQNNGDIWFCESCSSEVEPEPNLRISVSVEDETGNIKVIAFRENAEKIIGIDLEEVMNIIGETQDEAEPYRQVRDKVVGSRITVVGRVRYSDFSDQLEFLADEVY